MKRFFQLLLILGIIKSNGFTYSQSTKKFVLPDAVKIELNRLNEAYDILDKYSAEVWNGWNDYLTHPVLLTFENGLRVLVGFPDPSAEFVLYPAVKIHNLAVYIDTTKMINVPIEQPLTSGGGVSTLESKYKKQIKIVSVPFSNPYEKQQRYIQGEVHIITFMHELMHCFQDKLNKQRYSNLFIAPDLEYSVYSEIEGMALAFAFQQESREVSYNYLKDFCIARSYKTKNMKPIDIQSSSCFEFREGVAKYSEYVILNDIKRGYKSSIIQSSDSFYGSFANIDSMIGKYFSDLIESYGNVLEQYGKNYDYGCFQSILLDRYFPSWKKEIEEGLWLHEIFRKRLGITKEDSLMALQRFQNIYNIDQIKIKNGNLISARDETRKLLDNRKGRTYIIDASAIKQSLTLLVDKTVLYYPLGTKFMYPVGTGDIKFNAVEINVEPIPAELYRTTNLRIIDTNPDWNVKSYNLSYQSVDSSGDFSNVIIKTPVFTLKAPKISILENNETISFYIKSRF